MAVGAIAEILSSVPGQRHPFPACTGTMTHHLATACRKLDGGLLFLTELRLFPTRPQGRGSGAGRCSLPTYAARRSAHSTCRHLVVSVTAAGRQGSEAGDGRRSSSSKSSSSSDGRRSSGGSNSSSSKSSGHSSSQAKLQSILASAGLNSAELQRESPSAYSLLTVPMARILAEVHLDRLTTKAYLPLHPAQLMARICFLASDVGLTTEQIRARHGQATDTLLFDLDGAQRLLAWLRLQHVSHGQLQVASLSNLKLWSYDVGAAQRSKQHVQQRLGVTDAQWVEAFTLQDRGFTARPEVLDGVIAWLEAEPLGFSTAEVRQLWQSIPLLFAITAATLQRNLQGLLSRCPLRKKQLRSFIRGHCSLLYTNCDLLLAKLDSLVAELPGLEGRLDRLLVHGGTALNSGTDVLLCKVSCLLDYGFRKQELANVMSRTPMMLTCSWGGKLQPLLAALEGVLGSRRAVVAAVSKAPQLLGTALDTIKHNVRVLEEVGLSESEVQRLAARQPTVVALRLDSADFQATLSYFESVLGKPPRQMFVEYPGSLKSSLRRIDHKVSYMEHKGDTHYKTTLSWVMFSDDKFCQRYGYSLAKFRAWEEQWLQSQRAREYGLDRPRLPGVRVAQAARQKGRKAQVAALRKQRLAGVDSGDGAE